MSEMTIRERLEAIVDSFDYLESAEHAQAAIDLLDAAERITAHHGDSIDYHRLVLDPEAPA